MSFNSKQLIKEIEEPTRKIAVIWAQIPAKAPIFACLQSAVFILQHLYQAGNSGIASVHLFFLNLDHPYFEVFSNTHLWMRSVRGGPQRCVEYHQSHGPLLREGFFEHIDNYNVSLIRVHFFIVGSPVSLGWRGFSFYLLPTN